MRVLLIAMAESVHTARWIQQINDRGWELHLFPSLDYGGVHPEIAGVTVHHSVFARGSSPEAVKVVGVPVHFRSAAAVGRKALQRLLPRYRAIQLSRLIRNVRPDMIHSMETQAAGYLTAEARKWCREFPPWIHTVWGSDIYLFGRLKAHRDRIREVLSGCNYFICECQRDVIAAKEFGFSGELLLVSQATGGLDLRRCASLRQPGPPSDRRTIVLKGYQHWAGRALVGVRALDRCSDVLGGYRVAIFSASPEVAIAAELFSKRTGIPTEIIGRVSHDDVLRLQGSARISLSLSISDGVPNSLLEAMVMGAFPIQSWTACTGGWIEDGRTGTLVPPEDPEVIELAIRRALSDDRLVDEAAVLNWQRTCEKLDRNTLRQNVVAAYERVYAAKYRTTCGDVS